MRSIACMKIVTMTVLDDSTRLSQAVAIMTTLLLFTTVSALAQSYPTKPVRLVVGWPPGGAADGVARPLAMRLSEALGRPVLVDNRGGATGTIGAAAVAKAPADGYTLLLGTSNELVLSPSTRCRTTR